MCIRGFGVLCTEPLQVLLPSTFALLSTSSLLAHLLISARVICTGILAVCSWLFLDGTRTITPGDAVLLCNRILSHNCMTASGLCVLLCKKQEQLWESHPLNKRFPATTCDMVRRCRRGRCCQIRRC